MAGGGRGVQGEKMHLTVGLQATEELAASNNNSGSLTFGPSMRRSPNPTTYEACTKTKAHQLLHKKFLYDSLRRRTPRFILYLRLQASAVPASHIQRFVSIDWSVAVLLDPLDL